MTTAERASVFTQVQAQPQTLVDGTADQIRRLVERGEFQVGDRLPPERVLVERMGVSRTVLREALSWVLRTSAPSSAIATRVGTIIEAAISMWRQVSW